HDADGLFVSYLPRGNCDCLPRTGGGHAFDRLLAQVFDLRLISWNTARDIFFCLAPRDSFATVGHDHHITAHPRLGSHAHAHAHTHTAAFMPRHVCLSLCPRFRLTSA